jgi:dTDP-4-dehydrorhamnose reductase
MHVSTDYVFDGRSEDPLREDAPTAPLSAYGESKLRGEQAVAAIGGEHLIVRTSWLFGPGANFVRAIRGRAERGEDLRVVTDEAGRPTWTGTLARALLDVAESGARGTLHVANSGVTTRYEFACEIVRQVARRRGRAEVAVAPIVRADLDLPAERPAHAVLDIERARSLGLSLPDWREALTAYLDAEEEERDA